MQSEREKNWSVNIPLSDLRLLINQLDALDEFKAENARLSREVAALRKLYFEVLEKIGEMRRERTQG